METYQTYPGRIRDGRPVISGSALLPENANIFVTVLNQTGFEPPPKEDDDTAGSQIAAQREAFEKFVKAMAEIDDEPLDEEFFAIVSSGVNLKTKGLPL